MIHTLQEILNNCRSQRLDRGGHCLNAFLEWKVCLGGIKFQLDAMKIGIMNIRTSYSHM